MGRAAAGVGRAAAAVGRAAAAVGWATAWHHHSSQSGLCVELPPDLRAGFGWRGTAHQKRINLLQRLA